MGEGMPTTREDLKLLIRESSREGMEAFFEQHGLKPEHWVFVRLQYEQQRNEWSLVRRTVIAIVLSAMLVVGWRTGYDAFMARVVADSRGGAQHSAAVEKVIEP